MVMETADTASALAGLRVVECASSVAGAYCARLLGDAGADVIKVEPTRGDPARRRGPFPDDVPDPNWSGLFLYLNYNKRGITADLHVPRGREIVLRLLAKADVLVLADSAPELDRLRLYRDHLREVNPNLIVTVITPYGLTGPFRDYAGDDLTAINHGGLAYVTPGLPDIIGGSDKEPPLRANTCLSGIEAGIQGAAATLLAAFSRSLTGQGDQIDLSVHSAVASMLPFETSQAVYNVPNDREPRTFGIQPNVYIPCKDGYVVLAAWMQANWRALKEMMGNPDWAESEVFVDQYERARNWDALQPLLLEWTIQHTGQEIIDKARASGVPAFPTYTVPQMVQSEHLEARGFWVSHPHPGYDPIRLPGYPVHMSQTPWRLRRPAPRLGEHTREVLERELEYSHADINSVAAAGIISEVEE